MDSGDSERRVAQWDGNDSKGEIIPKGGSFLRWRRGDHVFVRRRMRVWNLR